MREQVQKSSMIRILGELRTSKVIDQNQKSRQASFIRASSIFLVDTQKKNAAGSSSDSSSDEENATGAGKPGLE